MRRQFLSLAVLVLSVKFAAAQDVVDNPEFASWSKYPKGTSITMQVSSEVAGMTTKTSMVTTLVEAGKEKLVLESATVINSNGMEFKLPASKRDVTKTLALPKGVKKEDYAKGKPEGTLEEGTETLKVAGKSVKTKWYRFKTEADGFTTESKMWQSDELPGMMVKMEATVTGAVASTTKMELVEFKKP